MDELYTMVFDKFKGSMLTDTNDDALQLHRPGRPTTSPSTFSKISNVEVSKVFLRHNDTLSAPSDVR